MLTDADCRNATCPPDRKRLRLTDEGGLYLEVAPNGSKRWFQKLYLAGKESRLAIGPYPKVSLKAARAERDKAKAARAAGSNPVQARRAARLLREATSATTFEAVAREFAASRAGVWSEGHMKQWLRTVEKDLFPYLGALPLADVSAPLLLESLRRVQARGALRLAHDLREYAGAVFRFGIATQRCAGNPAADLRGALKPFVEKHVAALTDPKEVGGLMRAIESYAGHPCTRAALRLSALTFQRPGNIRAAEWAHVDLDGATWTIPAELMKATVHGKANGRPHLVPLSTQAVAVLRELHPLTGHGRYLFPGLLTGERCMSENTVRGALRRLGYGNDDMSAHGFRGLARTVMAERLPDVSPDVVEAQLAHAKAGPLGAAYDRAEYVAQRRVMMQTWADYLDRLRDGGDVIDLAKRRA